MVNFNDLPLYAQNIPFNEKEEWIKKIETIKQELIIPLIKRGKPTFSEKHDFDFNKIKLWMNDDFISIVKFFLICIRELNRKGGLPKRYALVSLFMGNKGVKLLESYDEMFYGHLKMLEEIYMEYKDTNDPKYLEMMKKLCGPYLDVMKDTVYMCKGLFTSDDVEETGEEGYM